MLSVRNYNDISQKTYNKIKQLRKPQIDGKDSLQLTEAINQKYFDIGGDDYSTYNFIITQTKQYTMEMFRDIMFALFKEHEISNKPIKVMKDDSIVAFVINDADVPTLFLFKEFGMNHRLRNEQLRKCLISQKIKDYKYISLVDRAAYCEQFNHNDDESDPSRGTDVYPLRYFFERFFNMEEYVAFVEFEKNFIEKVDEYLGFRVVKTLTPNASFGFKKVVESSIYKFPFSTYLSEANVENGISDDQLAIINQQFFDGGYYKAMISNRDFANSFITSEWLYDNMKMVGNIDYTSVAMGYFKAIEQLLFDLIILHQGEGRNIHKLQSKQNKSLPNYIELNDENIKNNRIDRMLNSMIGFLSFEKNSDLFRTEISEATQKAILNELANIKELRNGYFHKDILSEWSVVEEARKDIYLVFYLILGSYSYSVSDKASLSIPEKKEKSDYQKLCEYINYHQNVIYYFGDDEKLDSMGVGQYDNNTMVDEYGDAIYSGAYFCIYVNFSFTNTMILLSDVSTIKKELVKYESDNMPARIYVGEIAPCAEGMKLSGPERLVFKDGVFVLNEENDVVDY